MRRNPKTITIQDVAKNAGVSVSTVSRVLNGKEDVAQDTVEKVKTVIQEFGYASSLAARGMRSHRTNVIGLIIPDVANSYCVEVMAGVNRGIAHLDYDLIIYTSGDFLKYGQDDRPSRYVTLLNGTIADGVIVVTPTNADFVTNSPMVVIDPNNETPDWPSIISTNRSGAIAAMEYLIGLGHRRIGFITGRLELLSANQRLTGYKEALEEAGIPLDESLIQVSNYTTEKAAQCARVLLSLPNRPTAIFASNDMSAVGVYQVAREMSLRIPEDLSVVGFDNVRDSTFLSPALTTIDQFIADMGTLAVEMIVKLIKGEAVEKHIQSLPTRLLVRESCSPPRKVGVTIT